AAARVARWRRVPAVRRARWRPRLVPDRLRALGAMQGRELGGNVDLALPPLEAEVAEEGLQQRHLGRPLPDDRPEHPAPLVHQAAEAQHVAVDAVADELLRDGLLDQDKLLGADGVRAAEVGYER